jgi:hypothetical protein
MKNLCIYLNVSMAALVGSLSAGANSIQRCGDLNLRMAAEGTQCRTSKGAVFKLVKRTAENSREVWKDLTTGLLWGDVLDRESPQAGALEMCHQSAEFYLPTQEEFAAAEQNGFREALPNMKDRWFWTASIYEEYPAVGYDFSGNYGTVNHDYFRYGNHSVRCVSR